MQPRPLEVQPSRLFSPVGLLQLRILAFSLLQDGDVGVGILPEGKEILVSGDGANAGGIRARRRFRL